MPEEQRSWCREKTFPGKLLFIPLQAGKVKKKKGAVPPGGRPLFVSGQPFVRALEWPDEECEDERDETEEPPRDPDE